MPRLAARDAAAEAVAGIVQRPGRAVLTMLGTVLGVGAFVAVLGLTATGAGEISRQFTVLEDTTVTRGGQRPRQQCRGPRHQPGHRLPGRRGRDRRPDPRGGRGRRLVAGRPPGGRQLHRLPRPVGGQLPDGHPAGRLARRGRGHGSDHGCGRAAEQVRERHPPARRDARHDHGDRARDLRRPPGQPARGVRRRDRLHGRGHLPLRAARGDRRERHADPAEHGPG